MSTKYTVYKYVGKENFADIYTIIENETGDVISMSNNPTDPQGVNMYAGHQSKLIDFDNDTDHKKLNSVPLVVKAGLEHRGMHA